MYRVVGWFYTASALPIHYTPPCTVSHSHIIAMNICTAPVYVFPQREFARAHHLLGSINGRLAFVTFGRQRVINFSLSTMCDATDGDHRSLGRVFKITQVNCVCEFQCTGCICRLTNRTHTHTLTHRSMSTNYCIGFSPNAVHTYQ